MALLELFDNPLSLLRHENGSFVGAVSPAPVKCLTLFPVDIPERWHAAYESFFESER